MKPIPILGLGTKSRSANVTAQGRTNMYLEKSDDKGPIVAYGTPGLTLFTDLGDTPPRGLYALGVYLYVVHRGTFYQINNAGVATAKGTLLTTSGQVDISNNITQITVVDGANGYNYTIASGVFARITDGDFPGADTIAFNAGFYIVNKPATGQFWLSQSYNGASWVATDFATAETNPDDLVRVAVDHGELILFGDLTTEFWVNTGALDFPYTAIGGATAEWGLAARWSVTKFDNSLMWLAKNRMGEVQVVRLNGYQPTRVSTFDIENLFNSYFTVSDATAFSYLYNGHPFYQINFPTAGESWLYDGAMNCWSRLKSGDGRHRSNIGVVFGTDVITADYENGKLYKIDGNNYTDDSVPIVAEITGKHVFNGGERLSINDLWVDCETGVATATGEGSDPQMMLKISKDGGHTSYERWASMGKLGEYTRRAIWHRLGQSKRDWTFTIRISAPVKRAIMGAWINGG